MKHFSLNDINRFLLYKQHLMDKPKTEDLVEVVKDIAGLHATIPTTPYLSLFARISSTKDLLDEELHERRHLGKIRCIRKAIYIFPREMLPILHAATHRMNEKQSKKALEYRGISSDTYQTISDSILELLKDRNEEMTAPEIKKALQTELNISYILYHMCDQKLLIRGKPRKYFLFDEYFPNLDFSINEPEAISQLITIYLQAFGPVTEKDIIWWTGLGKTLIKEAFTRIQQEIAEIKVGDLDKNLLILQSEINLLEQQSNTKRSVVNLLPCLDSYIMGYKERKRYFLSNDHIKYVFDRTGNATSVILSDGRIVGVWDYIRQKKPVLKFCLFEENKENIRNSIVLKASKIGEFICNTKVLVEECESMIPLNERTVGSFMSPLKEK